MGFPRGILAKTFKQGFRYTDTITLDPTSGGNIAYHTFSANGLYDPDITGVGHQPMGFDQLIGVVYNHYTVIGAKLRATFMSQNSTTTGQAYVGIMQLAGSSPVSTSFNDVAESKHSKLNTMRSMNGGGRTSVVSKISLSKWLGQKVLQEDANAGTSTTNPTEQVYWAVYASSNFAGTTDPAPMRVLIEIEYVAILHEPRQLAGS